MVYKTISMSMAERLGLKRPDYAVTYHEQEDHGADQYCGAASAQMVLESIGAGRIDQEVLYTGCKTCSAKDQRHWDSAPDGLVCTLNQHRPAGFPGSFRLWELPSEEAISRKLCWAIEQGVAPIVLTSGASHWMVVVGYEASALPRSSTDTAYQIIRFEVCDPEAGFPDQSIYYCPKASRFGKKRYWARDCMIKIDSGFWKGKFLAICDPDPPADIPAVPNVFV